MRKGVVKGRINIKITGFLLWNLVSRSKCSWDRENIDIREEARISHKGYGQDTIEDYMFVPILPRTGAAVSSMLPLPVT